LRLVCAAGITATPNKAAHPTAVIVFLHFVAPFTPWMASAFWPFARRAFFGLATGSEQMASHASTVIG
jgi:hypothetical protein